MPDDDDAPVGGGIVVRESRGVILKNNSYRGPGTAIAIENSQEIDIDGLDHVGPGVAVDIRDLIGGTIQNVTTSETLQKLQETPETRSLIQEAAEVVKQSESDPLAAQYLMDTRLGRWLRKQKFVDWARLVAQLSEL
ncbi:hypothetical protein ACGYLA_01610 [Sulfitobacter sp. 1A13679]